MTCNHCGADVREGTTFCTNCGQPVEGETAPAYTAAAPVNEPQGTPVKMGGYLTWAIITTAACAWPFGIPAIVNATRINKCNQQGDFEGARQAAKKSKTWSIVAGCVDIVFWIIYAVAYGTLIANYL